jgi:hypothetical protein
MTLYEIDTLKKVGIKLLGMVVQACHLSNGGSLK